jgi:type VI secretion system protein ImpG
VQFVLDPDQGKLTSGYRIAQDAALYSQPVNDTRCQFRTCYPVPLWPIELVSARLESPDRLGPAPKSAVAMVRLELHCQGGTTLAELALDRLRFFLHGESSLIYALYELLFNNVCQVQLRPLGGQRTLQPIVLSPGCLHPVGFGPDEGILPYTPRSFLGYWLLQEYFAFPEKFLFCDVCELDRAVLAGFGEGIEICLFLDRMPRLEQAITKDAFRLGCTPVVNLFEHIAEPIRVHHAQTEYHVIPDVSYDQKLWMKAKAAYPG